MSQLKRILIIENSIHVTGALKSIIRVAFDLDHLYTFTFVLPAKSRGRFLVERFGFNSVYELPMKELSRKISAMLMYVPYLLYNSLKIASIIRTQKIDLVHSNDLYNLTPVIYKLFGGRKPYICHIRFLPTGFPPLLFKIWFSLHTRFAKRIIVVSNHLKNQLPSHPKVECIPNELPIEERYDKSDDATERMSYTFLYLANFISGKGQNFALEAFAKVAGTLPQWKLRFAGGDMGLEKNMMYRNHLKVRASELNIADRVEWIDFVEDTEKEYKSADIILNFSESESFSITCLEALFYGRPLIATDCGGPAEIIEQNYSGILVPNRDIDAMQKAMVQLAENKNQRITFGTYGRKASREKFSLENTSFKLAQVYDEVLKTSTSLKSQMV